MNRALSTLLSVTIILSGTALIDHLYQPGSKLEATYLIQFPGEGTDREILNLDPEKRVQLLSFLNEAPVEQFSTVEGIASVRSDAIRKARPFRALEEVREVEGIGERTYSKIIAHASQF